MDSPNNQLVPLRRGSPGRLRSTWYRYQNAKPMWHVGIPLGIGALAGYVLTWTWTMLDQSEYGVAMILVLLFLILGIGAAITIREKRGQAVAIVVVIIVSGYSGLKSWRDKENKPWFPVLVRPAPTPSPLSAKDMETAVEKGITKSQRMELTLEIHGVFGGVTNGLVEKPEKPDVESSPLYLLVGVTLVNSGKVPTAAHAWGSLLEIEGKGKFEGSTVQFSSNYETFNLNGPQGVILRYSFEDFLTVKTNKPILPGETVPGLLMFKFDQLINGDVIPPARICVRCSDSQHTPYATCYPIESIKSDFQDFAVPGLRPAILEKGP